jgi:hypothetical protein
MMYFMFVWFVLVLVVVLLQTPVVHQVQVVVDLGGKTIFQLFLDSLIQLL